MPTSTPSGTRAMGGKTATAPETAGSRGGARVLLEHMGDGNFQGRSQDTVAFACNQP